ncbi:hypothetical protein YC2023_052881 [Brassica napus]
MLSPSLVKKGCNVISLLFFSQSSLSPPSVFPDVVDWVRTVTSSKKVKAIIKLIFQACIYFLWLERNSRLHSAMLKPSHVIQREIQLQIRARLLGLDRESYKALATHLSQTFEDFSEDSWKILRRLLGKSSNVFNPRRLPTKFSVSLLPKVVQRNDVEWSPSLSMLRNDI